MAEKETTSGNMFERAGYALGQSEAPTTGSNYAKDWVDSYQQVTKADQAGAKLANLLAKNPDGVNIPKIPDSTFPRVQEYLTEKRSGINDAHSVIKKNNTDSEEYKKAVDYLNNVESEIAQLNTDFEQAAAKRKLLLDSARDGTFSKMNSEEQNNLANSWANDDLTQDSKIIDGRLHYRNPNIEGDEVEMQKVLDNYSNRDMATAVGEQEQADVDAAINFFDNQYVQWDEADTGGIYNYETEDMIDAELSNLRKQINPTNAKNALTKENWQQSGRKDLETNLNKLSRTKEGRDSIKQYMFQNDELIDEFVLNLANDNYSDNSSVVYTLEDLKNIESQTPGVSIYNELKEKSKEMDFGDGFTETILNMMDKEFPVESTETKKDANYYKNLVTKK